jgi:hypothetical protein
MPVLTGNENSNKQEEAVMSHYENGNPTPGYCGLVKIMATAIAATGFLAAIGMATTTVTAPTSQPATQASASQPAIDNPTELVNRIVRAYLKTHEALTKGDLAAARKPMPTIMQSGNALHEYRPGMAPLLSEIGTQAGRASDSQDLAGFRDAFGRLSPAVIELVKRIPPTAAAAESLYAVHCPMVKKDWLQTGKEIRNPYDPNMLSCGVLKGGDLIGGTPRDRPR